MEKSKLQHRIEALENLRNAKELEKMYAHLEHTFEHHDDWVNFIHQLNIY